jgi:hypothetical protein
VKEIIMIEVVLATLPAAPGKGPDRDERDLRPDYAARLRNALHDASGQALISREDAIGAAAEIEQLWTAFRIMVSRTNGDTPRFCQRQCCNWPSERLHAED